MRWFDDIMKDLGKQLVLGFVISISLHVLFIFFAGMQYREQVKNIFWINAESRQEEKKVYFASVVKPIMQEPIQKTKAAGVQISERKKEIRRRALRYGETSLPAEQKKVEQEKTLVQANSGKKVLKEQEEPLEKKVAVEKKVSPQKMVSEKELMQKEPVVQEPVKKKIRYQHASKEMIQKQQAERKARERFFVIAQAIKQEIATHWHPPLSDEDLIQAKVCCTLSPRGKVEQVDIIESSMIMAYDASILRALWKCNFIQDLWGKRFLLVLKK